MCIYLKTITQSHNNIIYFSLIINNFIFLSSFLHYSTPTTKLNGQTTPLDVTGLSQNELHGLLIGPHPSSQTINVKREPEDLRKEPKCQRSQKVRKENINTKLTYNIKVPIIISLLLAALRCVASPLFCLLG